MIWNWKRPAAFFLAAAMIVTMSGVPASAVEPDGSAVSGNAPAECSCETHCEQEAVNPDCPVCSAEDADLSACKGTEQAMSLMADASSTETISGEVTWNNQTFTTPVKLTGNTTLTLVGDNKIECGAPLDLNNCKLTVKGTGTLEVIGSGRSENSTLNGAIFDSAYKGTNYGKGTLSLEGGTIKASGGRYNAISVCSVYLKGGNLEAYGGSNAGIVCSYLYTYGGSLYATGDDYGIEMRTMYAGNPGNLPILASDEKNASMAEMDEGDIGDIQDNAKKRTYYIGEVTGPLFSVKTQKGTLYEGVAAQKATFAISAKNVDMTTLEAQWVGDHTGLTASLSADHKSLWVTTSSDVKQGTYSLTVTVTGTDGTTVTKTVTVTVSGAPITISQQPQVRYQTSDEQIKAYVSVDASLASDLTDNITYQWYVNEQEFTGTVSDQRQITLTKSDLTTTEGKDWEYSGQVYCKLSYQGYTVQTNSATVTISTCTHDKYTHKGKCQRCGEPCRAEVLFIDEDSIPFSSILDNAESQVGGILFSGGTFYFVRNTDAILRAGTSGGDVANKMDVTLDLDNFPYNSVTIKNGTIGNMETKDPTVCGIDIRQRYNRHDGLS